MNPIRVVLRSQKKIIQIIKIKMIKIGTWLVKIYKKWKNKQVPIFIILTWFSGIWTNQIL